MRTGRLFGLALGLGLGTLMFACGSDHNNGGPGENAGSSCASPAECYLSVDDPTTLAGEIQCLSKVPGGYCTHLCTSDADCCTVPGECATGHPQVCAPFENTGQMYCFLSCEDSDWQSAGSVDANDYCYTYANTAFNCRSTGGGSKNRKVCAS